MRENIEGSRQHRLWYPVYLPEKELKEAENNRSNRSLDILNILESAPARIPEKTKNSMLTKRAITSLSFLISDFISIILATKLINWILPSQINLYVVGAIFLLTGWIAGLYSKRFTFWDETGRIIKVCFVSLVIYIAVGFISTGHTNIVQHTILCFASVPILVMMRRVAKELMWYFGLRIRAIIIGGGLGGMKIIRALDSERTMGYDIIGVLDDDRIKQWKPVAKFHGKDVLVIGNSHDIWNIIEETPVDEVIIAIPSIGDKALTALAIHLQKFIPVVTIVPDMFGLPTNAELGHSFGEQTIFLSVKNNLANPINRFIKRTFDIIAGLILFVLIAPIMLIIAIMIKLDSKGPVFFKQERVGKNGKKFNCLKFRTMHENNEDILREYFAKHPEALNSFLQTGKIPGDDPRVTRIGKFLRKFSLDELPQIINVLKGEMSLVGPRALVPDEVEMCKEYYMEWAYYINPGITGLAQVMGRANISHIDKNMISLWYMRNWSLWLDIIIILKTIKVVLKTEGAY